MSNVVNLANYRQQKNVSEQKNNVKDSSPHFRRPEADDFGDRMQRIRASLEKINQLMADLKKLNDPVDKK